MDYPILLVPLSGRYIARNKTGKILRGGMTFIAPNKIYLRLLKPLIFPTTSSSQQLMPTSRFSWLISDMPTQMPPLTPGTNKKLTEVLKASFASWEKEVQNCNITKGMCDCLSTTYTHTVPTYQSHGVIRHRSELLCGRSCLRSACQIIPSFDALQITGYLLPANDYKRIVFFFSVFFRKTHAKVRSCWYIK